MNFECILHIDQIKNIIRDKDEFLISNRHDYQYVCYNYVSNDTFGLNTHNYNLLRELRGLKFDLNGNLVQRPYHKFFNLNENPLVHENKVDLNNEHVILEKLDGSMVHQFKNQDGSYRLMTKRGDSETAERATKFLLKNDNIIELINEYDEHYTVIFEWVSPDDRIVVKYDEDNLIVTAIRDKKTGEYVHFNQMQVICDFFKVTAVQKIETFDNIKDLAKSVSEYKDIEGIVLRFQNGEMLKIKAFDYLTKHKTKEFITDEYSVFNAISEDVIDDLIPLLGNSEIHFVNECMKKYKEQTLLLKGRFLSALSKYKDLSNKEYAINYSKNNEPFINSFVFESYKNDIDIDVYIKNLFKKNLTNRQKFIQFQESLEVNKYDK